MINGSQTLTDDFTVMLSVISPIKMQFIANLNFSEIAFNFFFTFDLVIKVHDICHCHILLLRLSAYTPGHFHNPVLHSV